MDPFLSNHACETKWRVFLRTLSGNRKSNTRIIHFFSYRSFQLHVDLFHYRKGSARITFKNTAIAEVNALMFEFFLQFTAYLANTTLALRVEEKFNDM